MTAAVLYEERDDPGKFSSALLSGVVHAVLLAVLIFGVRWQSRPPEAVQVELWLPPPAPVVEAPKPEPAPKVEPAPPPKPEPVIPKPEIVERKAPPPKPKAEPKPEPVAKAEHKPPPKPVPKPEPLKPKVDDTTKRMQAELAREQAAIAVDRERQMLKDLAAASDANSKAQAAWIDKVRAKIRGNIVLPQNIQGNPEAIFTVVQLPTGEVLPPVKLKKSSGVPALDAAIERAVLKSSPLPKPDSGFTAPREFELKYKPLD